MTDSGAQLGHAAIAAWVVQQVFFVANLESLQVKLDRLGFR
jgi:hypothetical protein